MLWIAGHDLLELLFCFRVAFLTLKSRAAEEPDVLLVVRLARQLLGLVERLLGIAEPAQPRVHLRQSDINLAIIRVGISLQHRANVL